MSYTAPQYVDTKEKAVLALASTIAGEDKTALGDGSVNTALDVLADVLAGQDVEVPQTNAGAILALAQYVGGGGGAEIGEMQTVMYAADTPAVGQNADAKSLPIGRVSIGGKDVAFAPNNSIVGASAGADISWLFNASDPGFVAAYDVTVDDSGKIPTYATVEQVALETEYALETFTAYSIPSLGAMHYLVLHLSDAL